MVDILHTILVFNEVKGCTRCLFLDWQKGRRRN